MSNLRYKLYKVKATPKWISEDFLVLGWLKMNPKTLNDQIQATKHRLQIYEDEFMFNFVEALPEDLANRFLKTDFYDINAKYSGKDIKDKIKLQKQVHKNIKSRSFSSKDALFAHSNSNVLNSVEETKVVGFPTLRGKTSDTNRRDIVQNRYEDYKGEAVLREIALLETALVQKLWMISIIVIIRICTQIGVQLWQSRTIGWYWYESILTLAYIIVTLFLYGVNFLFVFAGIIDFKRKLFFMKVCQSMISPEKDEDFMFATFFPTINVCCTKNLASWMTLRRSLLDLGKKYTYRIFLYCSVFLAFYLTFFIFLMLTLFGLLKYQIPLVVYITGTYDVVMILGVILIMIRTGAKVNSYYDIHIGTLMKLKRTLWDAKNNFGNVVSRHKNEFTSQIYSDMLKAVTECKEDKEAYLEDAITFVDMIIGDLQYEFHMHPLKLLGFT